MRRKSGRAERFKAWAVGARVGPSGERRTIRFPSTFTSLVPVISPSPERAPLLHIPARISHMTSRRAWPTSTNTSKPKNSRSKTSLSPVLSAQSLPQTPSQPEPGPRPAMAISEPPQSLSFLTTVNGLPILSSSMIQRIPFPIQDHRPRRLSRLSIQSPCRSRSRLQSQSRSLQLRLSFLCRQIQSRRLLPSSTSPFPHFPSARRPSRKQETSPPSTSPSS